MSFLATIKGYLISAGLLLLAVMGYKHEKKKRKQAERDRDTANANVDLLERKEEIITDMDIRREKDNDKAAEMFTKQKVQLEKLKDETDNSKLTAGLTRLLNKNNHKD